MGRPPKPIEQKRKLGNPGKRPLPAQLSAVPAVASDPEPAFMEPDDVFGMILSEGASWLARTDAVKLAILRESLEERAALREVVLATQSGDARTQLRDLDGQISKLLSECGFDPAARSRLGLAEVKAQTQLEKALAARATRRQPGEVAG